MCFVSAGVKTANYRRVSYLPRTPLVSTGVSLLGSPLVTTGVPPVLSTKVATGDYRRVSYLPRSPLVITGASYIY